MKLRDYQSKLIADIYSQWQASNRRVLAQSPTGSGKTVLFSAIASDFTGRGLRVLVIAHREEIIVQAADKLAAVTGEPVGIIKADYSFEPLYCLQVASIQTLVNRLDIVGSFDLIIIDECQHHQGENSYGRVLARYPNALILGVTATPIRGDGGGFDDLYDVLVCGPTTGELIEAGHLSRYRLLVDENEMVTKGVKTTAGDFNQKQLAAANNAIELAGSIVGSYREKADGKRAICFAINVAHSKAIAHAYNEAGIPAVHLDGNSTSDERKAALAAFADGSIKVLSNCALFTEGFDLPAIEAVQIAKPTKSLSLWLQMLGRGLRTAPGKTEAILIDHSDNWRRLGTPTRPRLWMLEGVEVEPREMKRGKDGEVEESEPIAIAENDVELKEIILDPLEEWRDLWREMVAMQKERKYNPAWLGYRLSDLKPVPPLEIWQLAADYLGYKPGWAWHKHRDAQQQIEEAA